MITGEVSEQLDIKKHDDSRAHFAVPYASRTEPLRECVRTAVEFYFKSLDGFDVHDLHDMVIKEVERPLFETVLCYTQGNQTWAARILGMSRGTLRKKLSYYGISHRD